MPLAPRPRSRALAASLLLPVAALGALPLLAGPLIGLVACDPTYEPPPKAPERVYIPWQTGPARGPRRATDLPGGAARPTAAPSVAPSVELEDVDEDPDAAAPAGEGGPVSSASTTPPS